MAIDLLSNALNAVKVAELKGKTTCGAKNTKLIRAVFNTLRENGYVKEVKENGYDLEIVLNGSINNCGSIKPRFHIKSANWEKYETRFLPSKAIGIILVSTSQGLMTHTQAKAKSIGGSLLAFVY
ncbi:MAG: 30S ribosomal protein S8 [Candidatus Micrarchaeota archaeon]